MTSFDALLLLAVYQPVNVVGTEFPCSVVNIINTSDVPIIISFDGVTDHDMVRPHESNCYDFQKNAQPQSSVSQLKKNTQLYVRWVDAAAKKGGDIYFNGYTNYR
jgi:hypothetical protein